MQLQLRIPDELTSFAIYAVEGILVALIVRFGFRALQRLQHHGGLVKHDAVLVSYGWGYRIVVLACLVGLIALLVAARLGGANERVQALFLFLVLTSAACCLEFYCTKLLVFPDRLERWSIWRRSTELRWKDIVSVTWSDSAQWFCLRAAGGEKAYVHSMMNGVGAMADKVLELVRREAYDSEALARLSSLRAAALQQPGDSQASAKRPR